MTDVFSKLNCWHCLTHEVSKSNLLCKFLDLKWEFIRRKLALNLLSRSAKCFANPDQIEEAHENILRRISLLVGRNLSCTLSSITLDLFCHLVAKEIPGDIFAIERANIVYDVCRFSLELYHSETTRTIFDNPSSIKFGDLANYPMIAFVLSREVPMVLREVSLLLAVMYTISDTCTEYSQLLPFSKTLKENRCSLYFHQASIDTHFTWKLLSQLNGRFEDPAFSRSSCIKGTFKSLRLPETLDGIEEHVNKFLADLPSRTTVGISMLGHGYNSLLQNFLADFTRVEATILVSRRNSKKETCVKLLPVTSILQAEGDLRNTSETYAMYAKPTCDWRCSWDFTVIDDVAPIFRTILEEDYWSVQPLQNSERLYHDDSWWIRRRTIDQHVQAFLRKIEESWFGSNRVLLLGENSLEREPIILVLDHEVQMLPWENIPSLRYEEVHRMPSFSSIQFTHRSSRSIDPLNAFYLLNPDGDLPTAETVFKRLFEHLNLEGMAGFNPPDKDLASKLKSRDLFFYSGHGSGEDHIPGQENEKIDNCPAAILLGCCSGSLTLEGSYAPQGVAQSYLLAGSPAIVATLWNVTGDIDRFGNHFF